MTTPADRPEPPPPEATPRVVLLVDDNAEIRAMLGRALRRCGCAVLEAPGGAEALALARALAGPLDLLVAHLLMPRMTGPELAARVRALHPGIPVLYFSGEVDAELLPRAFGAPADPVLRKPFRLEQVAARILALLGKPGPS